MAPSPAGALCQFPPDYNRYEREYGPFNFATYDDEDFYFDWDGYYARYFIFGGKEATGAANKATFAYRCAADQVAEASGPAPAHRHHLGPTGGGSVSEDRSPAELGRGPPKPPIYEDYGVRLRRDLGQENAHRPFIPKNLRALCALCGETGPRPPAPGYDAVPIDTRHTQC